MRKKRIIFGVFFLILVIGGIGVFIILNRPSNGLTEAEKQAALSKILGRPLVTKEKYIPTGNTVYKGQYASFAYPEAAEIFVPKVDGSPMKTGNLEDFDLDLGDPRIHLVSSVAQVSSSTALEDLPSIRLRQDQSSNYKQIKITAGGKDGLLFESSDSEGNLKTAFFLVNSKVFIFSVSGADSKRIDALSSQIFSTLKFL